MKNKTGFFEKLFYNNKFLLFFSLLLSIVLWATVEITYSDNTTRTINDIKVAIDTSLSEDTDFVPFINQEDLYVDVRVTGKAYNINSYSLVRSDIIVEANTGYIDSSGYKVLNLTARTSKNDVTVTGIYPSTITVFFDKESKSTFNVEAKLNNDLSLLSDSNYLIGQPVASMSTIDVSGPATVVEQLKKVYFEATLEKDKLPLTATTQVTADISYVLDNERGSQFLVCDGIEETTNPATITIPVSKIKTVKTAVKFINEPSAYENEMPKISINPSEIKISYNPEQEEEFETLNVGTIDFRNLDNKINTFDFSVDEKNVANIVDKTKTDFKVTVDMSNLSKKVIDKTPGKIVTVNQANDYKYDVSLGSGLDEITIIGPESSLKKITADDLQVEINVSSLSLNSRTSQRVEVSNISINTKDVHDCWIYGKYYVNIKVTAK